MIGLDGLGAEIVKNLVLSGVKSIMLHDDKDCTVLDTYNQFLISADHMGLNVSFINLFKQWFNYLH